MLEVFWDLHQERKIAEAKATADRTKATALDAVAEVKSLEDRLERLTLVTMALWSMLQERTGLTEEELVERVRRLDILDGRLDGKAARKTLSKCEMCGKTMSMRHARCLFCGAESLTRTAFEGVL